MDNILDPQERGILQKVLGKLGLVPNEPAFYGFKALGDGKFVGVFSNNFKDRDNEIITDKAHTSYVKRLDMGLVPLPELWIWHEKAWKIGQVDHVVKSGHMMVALGRFDANPLAKQFEKFARRNPDKIAMSHGFTAPDWAVKDGLIEEYNTFEVSVLPRGKEANTLTNFMSVKALSEKDMTMPVPSEKIKDVQEWFGNENDMSKTFSAIDQSAEQAREIGMQFKSFADFAAPDTAAPAQPADDTAKVVLASVLEAQAHHGESIDVLAKALKGVIDHHQKELAAVKSENEALKASIAAINSRLALAPRGVEDSPAQPAAPANAPVDMAKAAQVIDAQNQPEQAIDPFFSRFGMKVAKR